VSNAWSTAQAIYLLHDLDNQRHKEEIEDAARWLVKHRNPDHGWGFEPGVSDVTGTEQAIYALSTQGDAAHAEVIQEAVAWLIDRQNPTDNGWAFAPRNTVSSVYCTAWAMASLAATKELISSPIVQKVHVLRGKKFLQDAQSQDRRDPGWGKFHQSPTEGMRTAHALIGLSSAGAGRSVAFRSGLRALRREQSADGGWGDDNGSNVEGTSWAVVALLDSSSPPRGQSAAHGVSYLLGSYNKIGAGWPEQAGGRVQVWCTHHALFALNRYHRSIAPMFETSLIKLTWTRVHAVIVGPIFQSRYRWVFAALGLLMGAVALMAWFGGLGTAPAYVLAHANVIAVIAGILGIANIVRVVLKDHVFDRKKR
jgi:Squalene-hopene cyclase C-terminal domain/Prenyltransferase and squalene oxidase repeat